MFTIEVVKELAHEARARLLRLGYANVHVRAGDGYAGWPEEAPFDRVLVTAAPDEVPETLLDQLADDGILVVPAWPMRLDAAGSARPREGSRRVLARRKARAARRARTSPSASSRRSSRIASRWGSMRCSRSRVEKAKGSTSEANHLHLPS